MQAVLSLVSMFLPFIIKILGFIIDKKKDDGLRVEFLKFVTAIENDVTVNLRKEYRDQLLHIKEELRLQEITKNNLIEEHLNYKTAYEKLSLDYKRLEENFKELSIVRSEPARRRGRPKNQNRIENVKSTNQN